MTKPTKSFLRSSRRLVAGIAILVVACLAAADLKVVSEVHTSVNGDYRPTEFATTFYKGPWVRIDSKNRTILSNSATHKTIQIDHLTKTYSIANTDLSQQAADMMKMLQAKVDGTVTPTEDHKEIVGLPATKYLADLTFDLKLPNIPGKGMHMKVHMENWTTADLPVTVEAGSIVGSPNDMLQSLLTLSGVGAVKSEMKKIKGFSLSNFITMNLDSVDLPAPITFEVSYEALSTSTKPIPDAMFSVPSEYKRSDSGDDSDIPWRPSGRGG